MLFIATGGTIDKLPAFMPDDESFDHESKLFGKTWLPEMLAKTGLRPRGLDPIVQLFMIDSLDMTEGHRELLSVVIAGTEHEEIVVTHGTDTMPETARMLSRQALLASKKVVLTGAMIPYSMGAASDAVPNLRYAVDQVQKIPAGVYVAMNEQTFEANTVRKDREAGIFTTLEL